MYGEGNGNTYTTNKARAQWGKEGSRTKERSNKQRWEGKVQGTHVLWVRYNQVEWVGWGHGITTTGPGPRYKRHGEGGVGPAGKGKGAQHTKSA